MIKRTLFFATATAALMLGSTYESEAARCRLGSIYRPALGVCVSKHSAAARPYLARHRHVARVRLAKRVATPDVSENRVIKLQQPTPKIDLIGQKIADTEPSPYGDLVATMELFHK